MAPGIPSPHPTGRHASPGWPLPRGDCGCPHVLLAPRELWDPPRRVVVPKNPALRWGGGGVLPRHPLVPGVPRPHPLAARPRLRGGAVHSVGGPHHQGALDRPCLRLPVRLMALCRLQRIHHSPGGTPGTRGLTPGRPHTSMPRYGPRPRPPPPRHLYSHIASTWLNALLDQVDAAARRVAVTCPDTVGWLSPLQEPRVRFSHAGLQVHDALPHARRSLLASHHAYAKAPPPQRHPALSEYATVVSHGLLTWGDHLAATGIRLSLFPPKDTPCPLCLLPAHGDHILSCPLDPLLRAHYHRWLASRLS